MNTPHPLALFEHCPCCGASSFAVLNEKAKRCSRCGFTYFFNASAAVVACIFNTSGELLVCRRAQEPARGTLDLPGGFIDLGETAEEGLAREVLEETGLHVDAAHYLFSLPNIYPYSGLEVHTLDLFFRATLLDVDARPQAMDDAAEAFFLPLSQINPADFGLASIRRGVERLLEASVVET